MTKPYEINKLALQYAISVSPIMKKLAEPLQKYFGICSFSYMRIYEDCRYISLLNGYEEFNTKYFETIEKSDPHFIETMQNTKSFEPQFTIWPTEQRNLTPIMSLLDAFNIWHGFQISFRKNNYCELFSFTFDKQSGDKTSFFIKNIPILIKFVEYFKSHAGDLLDDRDKNKIAVFPQKFSIEENNSEKNIQNFLTALDEPFLLKDLSGNKVSLSKRESECLKIYATNKTAKEIASILNIAPRTIEVHISKIKQKLGLNYKNQLLEFCTQLKA